jgi:mutual gliding-motility protein MglA
MPVFNYAARELILKIVYYGPALCGKTTNLEYIYAQLPPDKKGKMLSLATESDRTLFFDFLPIELGTVQGWKVRVQLYTVPGQVFYDATPAARPEGRRRDRVRRRFPEGDAGVQPGKLGRT